MAANGASGESAGVGEPAERHTVLVRSSGLAPDSMVRSSRKLLAAVSRCINFVVFGLPGWGERGPN